MRTLGAVLAALAAYAVMAAAPDVPPVVAAPSHAVTEPLTR